MLKNGVLKAFLVFTLITSSLSITFIGGEKQAKADYGGTCYPAYKCMSKSSLPKSYKLYYTNKNRALGVFAGSTAIGAAGLIPGVSVASFLVATGVGAYDLAYGYASYKVYVKRSPKSDKIGRFKTVYYKDKNFKGSTKTVYEDWD